jgi:hypothetical protein
LIWLDKILMEETRTGKYGRNLAVLVSYVLESFSDDYRRRFDCEMRRYSFKGRKRGERKNSRNDYELEGIEEVDIENPEHLARLLKEGMSLMYQKDTARRTLSALFSYLEKRFN